MRLFFEPGLKRLNRDDNFLAEVDFRETGPINEIIGSGKADS